MHVQLSLFMVWQIKIDGDAYLNTLLVSSYFVQCTFCLLIPSIELELTYRLRQMKANEINEPPFQASSSPLLILNMAFS